MMEFVVFGLTMTVSLVVASLIVAFVSYKVMMSPKVLKKLYKDMFTMFSVMNEVTEDIYENLDKEEESE